MGEVDWQRTVKMTVQHMGWKPMLQRSVMDWQRTAKMAVRRMGWKPMLLILNP